MKPLLIIALLAGQTFYEWVDASGQSHYTDDPRTIPADAKRRVTQGSEPVIEVGKGDAGVSPKRRAEPAAPAPAQAKPVEPARGPDRCERAELQVRVLEQRIEEAKTAAAEEERKASEACQKELNLLGHGAYAQCMAARQRTPKTKALEVELEAAREELRKAKSDGCR